MKILDADKKEIQQIIESISPGSEMSINTLYKKYSKVYPVYDVYEEIQRVLKLNLRRFRLFQRENLLESVIARVEDFV